MPFGLVYRLTPRQQLRDALYVRLIYTKSLTNDIIILGLGHSHLLLSSLLLHTGHVLVIRRGGSEVHTGDYIFGV